MGCRGVWILDPSGDIVAASAQADQEIMARLCDEVKQLCEEGRSHAQFCPGSNQWIQLFHMGSHGFSGVVAVWDDRATEEHSRLEMESLAHDINNMLAVAQGHLELLQMGQERVPASLTEALWMLERAEDLVRRMGRSAPQGLRAERGSSDVWETLNHLTTLLRRSTCHVEVDGPPALPRAAIDRADLAEIFQNLLQNACDAMPDGGTITVQLSTEDEMITVAFRDRGAGIRSEQMDDIFSPHFTTKPTGHGLGLYRTRHLVEQSGGRIRVLSTLGAGSTFIVSLPQSKNSGKMSRSQNPGLR